MNFSTQIEDYYSRLWGKPSRQADFRKGDLRIGIYKWNADVHPEEVAFYATNGLAGYELKGWDLRHRLELFVGLVPEEDRIVDSLADLAISPILDVIEIGDKHTMSFPEPLWPGTSMQTLLVSRPKEEIIPPLRLPDGFHVEFMQVIPLFPAELQLKTEEGAQALIDRWTREGLPFWDPNRASLKN